MNQTAVKELTLKETNDIPVNSDIEVLATGASISVVGKLSGRVVFAVSQIALARMLGPELFGLYALGWAALRLVGAIAPLGLTGGVIRYGSRYVHKDKGRLKDIISRSLFPSLLFGLFAAFILFFLAPWLENIFASPGLSVVLRGFTIAIPLFVIMRVLLATTRIWQRMQYTVIAEDLGQPIANLLLVLAVFLLGGNLLGAVGAAVVSWGFAMLLAIYFVLKLFPDFFSVARIKAVTYSELLLFSLPTAFAGTFTFLITWMDRILLGLFATTADVGIYQALAQPALIITIILRSLNSIFSPMIANLYQRGETERLEELFKVSTKWGIYLSIPIFLFVCFASQEIMIGLFGDEYAAGAFPLILLTTGQMVNVSTGAVGFILIMTGHEQVWLKISMISFILNMILNVILIPRLGLIGAAIATAIAISALYLGGLFAVKHLVDLWPYDSRYKKGLVATAITLISLVILSFMNLENLWLNLIVTAMVSVTIFAGILWLLGLDPEDREFLALMLRKVRGSHG